MEPYLQWAIPVIVVLAALLVCACTALAFVVGRLTTLAGEETPQLWHIDEDELHIDCNEMGEPVVLSHHSAGEVYGGTYRGTRVVLTPRLVANTHDHNFEREAATVVSLRHPRIVTVFGLCELNARPYLVRELTAMGSLPDVLYGGTASLSPADIALILRDVVEGLLFLHSTVPTAIVHGALKPQNIFIEESWRAKVAFSGKAFARQDPQTADKVYQAPEVRDGQPATTESDVFCFGITAWETWTRTMPADLPAPTAKANADTAGLPMDHAGLTDDMRELLKECLSSDPSVRPRMDTVYDKIKHIFQKAPQTLPGDDEAKKADEKLLHSMLPSKVAQALRENRRVEAENFQMVTIFFSDIVGYTVISSKLKPVQVMALLDSLYSAFDHLAQEAGLFKVETIGDAYMAVAGLPEPQADHTLRVARFAMDAVKAAQAVPVDPDDPSLGFVNIRVGVHCGPVVASVVGKLNPRYCLFGDTVNTASRMESNSHALKINLSEEAAEQLRRQCPPLRMTSRGVLDIKGKGPMQCYFLDTDEENIDIAKKYEFGSAQPMMHAFGVMKGSMYQSKLTSFSRQSSRGGSNHIPDEEMGSPRLPLNKSSWHGAGTSFLQTVTRRASGGHATKSGPHDVSGGRSQKRLGMPGDRFGDERAPRAPNTRGSILQSLGNALGATFKRKVAPAKNRTPVGGGLEILQEEDAGAGDSHLSESNAGRSRDPARSRGTRANGGGGAATAGSAHSAATGGAGRRSGSETDDEKAKEAAAKAWESDESEEEGPSGSDGGGEGGGRSANGTVVVPIHPEPVEEAGEEGGGPEAEPRGSGTGDGGAAAEAAGGGSVASAGAGGGSVASAGGAGGGGGGPDDGAAPQEQEQRAMHSADHIEEDVP